MHYPRFSHTLLSFLLVLILHVLAIWLLLSPEKPQAKTHPPKVLLASLVAPATPKNITDIASSKIVSSEPVSTAKLKTDPTKAITTKPKSEPEKKPEPKIKALKPTPLPVPVPVPVPKTETETKQKHVPDTTKTLMPEKQQDHTKQNEASDNATETTNETDQTQDQVVTAIKVDAHSTQNFPPVYPKLSKRLKEQGTVILSMLISAQGRIEAISINESSGFSRLDQAALSAAAKWRYEPATINGKAIANTYLMPIEFKLNTSKR